MRTINFRYVMPLGVLLTLPGMILLFAPSAAAFALPFAVAVLVSAWTADYSKNDSLSEDEADELAFDAQSMEETIVLPSYLWTN